MNSPLLSAHKNQATMSQSIDGVFQQLQHSGEESRGDLAGLYEKNVQSPGRKTSGDNKTVKASRFETLFSQSKENSERKLSDKSDLNATATSTITDKILAQSPESSNDLHLSAHLSSEGESNDGSNHAENFFGKRLNDSNDSGSHPGIESITQSPQKEDKFIPREGNVAVKSLFNPSVMANNSRSESPEQSNANQPNFLLSLGRKTSGEQQAPRRGLWVDTSKPSNFGGYPGSADPYKSSAFKNGGQRLDSPLSGKATFSPLGRPLDSPTKIPDTFFNPQNSKSLLPLEELLEFKRLNCTNKNCSVRSFIATQDHFLYENDMYACPFYHNHTDRRRYPLHKNNLAKSFYVHDKFCEDCFNDPNKHKGRCYYCKNWFELFFHPKNYKFLPCKNRFCQKLGGYCPFYHDLQEKYEWDRILMESFQYDRRNVVFAIGVVNSLTDQLQSPANNYQLRKNPHQDSPCRSPARNPLQYQQTHTNSPHYGQNYNQINLLNQGFPIQQQNYQVQSPYLNTGELFSPQIQRTPQIDYTQQMFSPQLLSVNRSTNFPNKNIQEIQNNAKNGLWGSPSNQYQKNTMSATYSPYNAPYSHQTFSQASTAYSNLSNNKMGFGGFEQQATSSPLLGGYQSNNSNPFQSKLFIQTDQYDKEDQQADEEILNLQKLVEFDQDNILVRNKCLKNEVFLDENKFLEFKSYKDPVVTNIQKDELVKIACGFLNSGGGQIYIGADADGNAVGMNMSYKEFDYFKEELNAEFQNIISPSLDKSLYSIRRICILDTADQEVDLYSWRRIIIEIKIKPNDKVYFIKEKGTQTCYQRIDGATKELQGDKINELFQKKMTETMVKQSQRNYIFE